MYCPGREPSDRPAANRLSHSKAFLKGLILTTSVAGNRKQNTPESDIKIKCVVYKSLKVALKNMWIY
jgi:hypothetical protein